MNPHAETLATVSRLVRQARSILFITGAGVSAASGVPTYRGIGGLYEVDSTAEGLPIEEILSGETFATNPELSWRYLHEIALASQGATFNRAHEIIADMERQLPRVWTLTQNVDGFHRQAGSENVIELHGNMRSLSCTACSYRTTVTSVEGLDMPPRCPECQSIIRPDVILFGEMLPTEAVTTWQRELERGFSLVVSIGTGSMFPYIQEPIYLSRRWGGASVEINPSETLISHEVDYRLPLSAVEALEAIWGG